MDKIVSYHQQYFRNDPEVLSEVPGVCTLMGAFSDFCKGFCLTGTGALALRVSVSRREDTSVKLFDATRNEKKQFQLTTLKYRKEDRWVNYIKGVISFLVSEGHRIPCGLDITLKGALLFCDSLTISSALSIGILLALDKMFSFGLDRNAIIRISYQATNQFSHVHCRLRDLITMLYAEEGKVLYFDMQSMDYSLIDYVFGDNSGNRPYGIIIDPQVPPQVLRSEIEEKRQDAHDCCVNLSSHITDGYTLRDCPVHELKSHIISGITEHERRTCEYVITESAKVKRGAQALKVADAKGFGRSLRDIYMGMRDVFEVSCPEVDWLIKRAGESADIFGGSLISNGASGSIYLILTKDGETNYTSCLADYERIFGFKPTMRVFRPGGPAKVSALEFDSNEDTAGK